MRKRSFLFEYLFFSDFFVANIGTDCSFDFQKTSLDKGRLFVACRFETTEKAKEAMDKYRGGEILGYKVDLTWFKDIRRYASLQQQAGGGGGGGRYNASRGYSNGGSYSSRGRGRYNPSNRGGRDNDEGRKRYRSESRSRSRDRHSSSDRSRSVSRSRSRSPPARRRRSSSRDSRASIDSRKKDVVSEKRRSTSPDSDQERRSKKSKKHKKAKKAKRSRRSPSESDGEIRSERSDRKDISLEESPATGNPSPALGGRGNIAFNLQNTSLPEPPTPEKEKVVEPAVALQKATLEFKLEENEEYVPRPTVRAPSPVRLAPQPPPPPQHHHVAEAPVYIPTPVQPPAHLTEPTPVKAYSPQPTGLPRFHAVEVEPPTLVHPPAIARASPALSTLSQSSNGPASKSSSLIGGFKTYSTQILSTIRAETPQESTTGTPRIRRLVQSTANAKREALLESLDADQLAIVKAKARLIEKTYKEELDTYAFVANMLLSKDAALEPKLRFSLKELSDDLEKKILEEVDEFISAEFAL